MKTTILLVEDNLATLEKLEKNLQTEFFVETASMIDEAADYLNQVDAGKKKAFDYVIIDLCMNCDTPGA